MRASRVFGTVIGGRHVAVSEMENFSLGGDARCTLLFLIAVHTTDVGRWRTRDLDLFTISASGVGRELAWS